VTTDPGSPAAAARPGRLVLDLCTSSNVAVPTRRTIGQLGGGCPGQRTGPARAASPTAEAASESAGHTIRLPSVSPRAAGRDGGLHAPHGRRRGRRPCFRLIGRRVRAAEARPGQARPGQARPGFWPGDDILRPRTRTGSFQRGRGQAPACSDGASRAVRRVGLPGVLYGHANAGGRGAMRRPG
jgi:hypothetical protein